MWYFRLTVIYFCAYLLEAVIPLPIILVLLIAQASFDEIKTIALFSLLGGIITDIVLVRPLGTTCLFFLLTTFLVEAYRRKFREESLGFLFVFIVLITNLYLWVFSGWQILLIVKSLFCATLGILLTAFLYNLKREK